jgi:hypothetical protein
MAKWLNQYDRGVKAEAQGAMDTRREHRPVGLLALVVVILVFLALVWVLG